MSIFVGRNQELSTLESVLADVERGAGRCVLVSGEAGIGKSRLLAEIGRRAARAGFVALEGRCFEQDRSFAYAPIIDMLRTFYVPQSPSEIVNQLGPLAPKFARLLSELTPYITGQQTEVTLEPEAEKRLLFEALAHWIWGQAGAQPLFVVLEDLQWSDDASLEFLLFLARRVAAYPILLLLSYRSPVLQPDLAEFLAALDRLLHAQDIRLDPLTRQEVEAMMRSLLDLHEPIRPGFLDAIYDLTEGIPFFVEEVLSSLTAAGNLFQVQGRRELKPLSQIKIPRNTNRLVRARLEQLSPAARQVADLAAVSGRSFDFSVLQALTGYSDQALLDAIKELVAAHLVVEESAERFSFRHALTREALSTACLFANARHCIDKSPSPSKKSTPMRLTLTYLIWLITSTRLGSGRKP
jgi:predicted ATPase